jgi:hypothetical protein
MKAFELLQKLEEGRLLYRLPKEWNWFNEDPSNLLYFFCEVDDNRKPHYYTAGFGSIANVDDVLLDLIKRPEGWALHEAMVEDYPWAFNSRYAKVKRLQREWKYEDDKNL